MDRVMYIGRFQPFHRGHHHVVSDLRQENELIVGIGSSEKHGTEENPLRFFERYRVIRNCFPDLRVIAIPDRDDDRLWTGQILDKFEVDRAVSGEPVTRRCFRKADVGVEHPDYMNKEKYSGTHIRETARKGGEWRDLVPDCSLEILRDIGFEQRVRTT